MSVGRFLDFLKSIDCDPINIGDIVADDLPHYFDPKNSKKGKKSVGYQLMVDGDFSFGWVHNFRTGETHTYKSGTSRGWTDEEKRAHKQKIEAAEKTRIADKNKANFMAAEKSVELYKKCVPCAGHPYADKKRLIKEKLKVFGDDLVIPIYDNAKIVNLQTIDETGFKLFQKGAKITGCYGSITDKGLSRDKIIICEGYATGDALFQCLNIPVIVAFNASNLEPVARIVAARYPEARIIIAADNDQWTVIKGKPYNTGILSANKAAAAIGGAPVVYPEIAHDDEKKRTDWNDIFLTEGMECVKIAFEGALNHSLHKSHDLNSSQNSPLNSSHEIDDINYLPEWMTEEDVAAYEEHIALMYEPMVKEFIPKSLEEVGGDWRANLIIDSKGMPAKKSISNIKLFISHSDRLKDTFVYDCFSHKIMIVKCPPWDNRSDFKVREFVEEDIAHLRIELERLNLDPSKNNVMDCVKLVAMERKTNPAQRYFESLKWDGVKRLDKFLEHYFCANPNKTQPDDDPEYLSVIGKKFMVAAVKRVFEQGCKFDNMLVIEGEQYIGKSKALRTLCTFGNDSPVSYYSDAIKFEDIGKADTVQKMWGALIVEIPELSGLGKADVNSVKNWITNQEDLARLPYDRLVQKFKRQCVFAATSNDYEYLRDPTGNRRFWCFKAHDIDFDELERDRDQLWAEAYALYKDNYQVWLTPYEYKLAQIAQAKRMLCDPWETTIIESLNELDKRFPRGFMIKDVLSELGILVKDQGAKESTRARSILTKLGYVNKVIKEGQKTKRVYVRKEGFDL